MSVLCSFMQNPSLDCYNAALGLLIYVASSDEYVMKFDGKAGSMQGIDHHVHDHITRNHGLVAYSDASWHDSDELGSHSTHVKVMHMLFYFIPTRTPYSDSVTTRRP